MSISDDGEILEGSEDGEVITVNFAVYSLVDPIDSTKFTVSNLPTGVSKGSVTRQDATTAKITLSGNTSGDYDSNITDVSVEVDADQIDGYTGSNLVANSGVTLEPTLNISQNSITQGSSSDYSATFLGEMDSYTMKVTSNGAGDEGTEIFLDQNGGDSLNVHVSGGVLNIELANTTASNNTGAKIETAIQNLGTVDGVDYSTWTVSTSGDWDSGENGHRIYKSGTITATISGSTDVTEVVEYSIDDIIQGQDLIVKVNGVNHNVSVSSSDNEADVASSIASELNSLSTYDDQYYSYSNPSGSIIRFTSKLPNTNVEDVSVQLLKQ